MSWFTGIAGDILGTVGEFFGMKQQADYNREAQERQMQFNSLEAEKAHKRALELNKITYEQGTAQNKVKQLKEAGLNPALMYSGGGAGGAGGAGSASTGAQANASTGPGLSKPNYGQMLQVGLQMKMQAEQVEAQKKLADAEANKANAEADKIRGVDTESQNLENEFKAVRNKIANATGNEQIEQAVQATIKATAEASEAISRKNITTIEEANAAMIQAGKIAVLNAEAIELSARANLSDEQRKILGQQLLLEAARVELYGKEVDIKGQQLEWQKNQWIQQMDQNDKERTNKLWVAGIHEIGGTARSIISFIEKKTPGWGKLSPNEQEKKFKEFMEGEP